MKDFNKTGTKNHSYLYTQGGLRRNQALVANDKCFTRMPNMVTDLVHYVYKMICKLRWFITQGLNLVAGRLEGGGGRGGS